MTLTRQMYVEFSIVHFDDWIMCDVLPIKMSHILFSRPWDLDKRVLWYRFIIFYSHGEMRFFRISLIFHKIKLRKLIPRGKVWVIWSYEATSNREFEDNCFGEGDTDMCTGALLTSHNFLYLAPKEQPWSFHLLSLICTRKCSSYPHRQACTLNCQFNKFERWRAPTTTRGSSMLRLTKLAVVSAHATSRSCGYAPLVQGGGIFGDISSACTFGHINPTFFKEICPQLLYQ